MGEDPKVEPSAGDPPPPPKPDADAERAEWKKWRDDMDQWRSKHDEAHQPKEPDKTHVEPRPPADPPVKDTPTDPPAGDPPPKDDKPPTERHAGFIW